MKFQKEESHQHCDFSLFDRVCLSSIPMDSYKNYILKKGLRKGL